MLNDMVLCEGLFHTPSGVALYTREAIEERRHLRTLMRQSRMLIEDIE